MRRHAVHQGIPSPAPNTFDTSPENVGNARTAPLERQHDMFLRLAFEEGFDECPVEKNRRDGRVGGRRVRSGRGSGTGGVGGDRRDRVDDGDRRDRPAVVVVVSSRPTRAGTGAGTTAAAGATGTSGCGTGGSTAGSGSTSGATAATAHRCAPTGRPAGSTDRPASSTDRQRTRRGRPRTRRDRGPADPEARPVGPPRGALASSTRRFPFEPRADQRAATPRSGAVSGSLACSSRSAVAAGSSTIGRCPHPRNRTQRVCSGSWSRRRATPGSSTRSRVPNATVTGTVIAAPPLNRSFSRARSVSRNPGAVAIAWIASRAGS